MTHMLIDARTGGDWGLDLLFAGLVMNLGPDRVVDIPTHTKHREDPRALNGDPEHDWGLERRTLGYTPSNVRVPTWSMDHAKKMVATGQVSMIWLDERKESFEIYARLGAHCLDIPVVVVAGHDRFWGRSPGHVVSLYGRRLRAMFLDNWVPEYSSIPNAHRYSWSINFDHLWNGAPGDGLEDRVEKDIDICFMGYNSHPSRARFIDHILRRWKDRRLHLVLEREADAFAKFVSKQEYFSWIARSKIALNLRGAAVCGKAMRFFEIPYVGSCLLSEWEGPDIEAFLHEEHCMYFTDERTLDDAIDYLLHDDAARARIAAAGHAHAMQSHTVRRRVADMLEIVNG